MLILRSLFIEVRPNCETVKALLIFTQNITCDVKIRLKPHAFLIEEEYNRKLPLAVSPYSFRIRKKSLRNLKYTDSNWLTFTFDIDLDSFAKSGNSRQRLLPPIPYELEDMNIKTETFLTTDARYTIECLNCKTSLSKYLYFDTILPLSEISKSDGSSANCQIHKVPKSNEFFYDECFGHIREGSLCVTESEQQVLRCWNCNHRVGYKVDDGVYKIWFSSVCFLDIVGYRLYTDVLIDAILIIRSVHNNRQVQDRNKYIITYCGGSNFFLLWIIEDELHLHLLHYDGYVAKVLYKVAEADDITVSYWLKDPTVSEITMSKLMFKELLHHLPKIISTFPIHLKVLHGFQVSYLI